MVWAGAHDYSVTVANITTGQQRVYHGGPRHDWVKECASDLAAGVLGRVNAGRRVINPRSRTLPMHHLARRDKDVPVYRADGGFRCVQPKTPIPRAINAAHRMMTAMLTSSPRMTSRIRFIFSSLTAGSSPRRSAGRHDKNSRVG